MNSGDNPPHTNSQDDFEMQNQMHASRLKIRQFAVLFK
jgi:hypothetical protein